ncbi:hypothetical protein CBM2586_A10293 [Cupriavidus phytorum]|uniref:Uncharacterized protein n=1 Tax=Cupriavidus taiwanensis TaxID=164546 RepID=A0A375B9K7_9BURK|nr:hypothetical protein CBM2586_A10293 [Cupriavidus taiwanensis]
MGSHVPDRLWSLNVWPTNIPAFMTVMGDPCQTDHYPSPNFTERDSQEGVLMDHPDGLAISQKGWEKFVSGIPEALRYRLYAMEVNQCC